MSAPSAPALQFDPARANEYQTQSRIAWQRVERQRAGRPLSARIGEPGCPYRSRVPEGQRSTRSGSRGGSSRRLAR
jgi:hypothetical protein